MSRVLADRIEKYILRQLWENAGPEVILQRKDIAEALNCAPSQISYVLSTRFSNERGYSVESRRGIGGFIRITVTERPVPIEETEWTLGELDRQLYEYMQAKLITQREAKLMHEVYAAVFRTTDGARRSRLLDELQERLQAWTEE